MQIVIAGCGKVGSGFAQIMSEQGHDISVVDEQNDNFVLLGPNFKGITVWGSPIDEDVLKEAGIETADGFVAATPDHHDGAQCAFAEVFTQHLIMPALPRQVGQQAAPRHRFHRRQGHPRLCAGGVHQRQPCHGLV